MNYYIGHIDKMQFLISTKIWKITITQNFYDLISYILITVPEIKF